MKKLLAVLIFLLLSIPFAVSAEFRESKESNIYQYPDCKWAKKIHPENLIKFKTPEEATKVGLIPCRVCRPPMSSKSESSIIMYQSNAKLKKQYKVKEKLLFIAVLYAIASPTKAFNYH